MSRGTSAMDRDSQEAVLWRKWVRRAAKAYGTRARAKRRVIFLDFMSPTSEQKILDLGGGDGSHIETILGRRENVYVADIDPDGLARAKERGYEPVLLAEDGTVPFPDDFFDIVFCSSVIEHVTIPKEELTQVRSKAIFRERAWQTQSRFADEIRRVGKGYFVQTPYRYFLIESHSFLPMPIVFLPRGMQIDLLAALRGRWPKSTIADFNLLTTTELGRLFPDGEVLTERSGGMAKSIIAVRRP